MWVAVHLLGSIWNIDMLLWNFIQHVSGCALVGLYLNHWYGFMKSQPACEWLCTYWSSFELLTCPMKSSLWVAVLLLGFIWIPHIPLWNPIQRVSCAFFGLHLNHWHITFCLLFSLYMSFPTYLFCSTVNRPAISSQSMFKFLWRLNSMCNHISFFPVFFSYAFLII